MPSPPIRTSRDKWLLDQRMIRAFARIEPRSFGIACGVVAAVLVFAATVALVLKGPSPPMQCSARDGVGTHLELLAHVMPGYTVTWAGALLGAAWALAEGFVIGCLLAGAFNLHHRVYLRLIERRFRRLELLNG